MVQKLIMKTAPPLKLYVSSATETTMVLTLHYNIVFPLTGKLCNDMMMFSDVQYYDHINYCDKIFHTYCDYDNTGLYQYIITCACNNL